MKKLLAVLLFILGIIGGLVVPAYADSPVGSTYWWHTMSQSQRNSAIVNRANQNVDQWSGLSCKEWVRKVVYEASGNHVVIPPNMPAPYDYLWQNDPTGQVIAMGIPIQDVVPGYIIQMRLVSGWPHTVVVIAKDSTSVTFIESNWDSTPANNSDAYVRTRTLTFAQFYSQVEGAGAYFVYLIR